MPPSPTLRSSGDLLADRRYAYAEAALKDGDHRTAAELAEQCLERAPCFAAAQALLGRARAALGEREAALAALMRALDCDPEDALGVRIDLARLGAVPPEEAIGAGYVRALFDDYAGTFDKQLVKNLHYRGPELLRAAVRRAFAADGRRLWAERALDLGCGTGLAGQAFAGCYRRIEGVDLSPRMLAAARRTRLYDRLHEGDLLGFLREQREKSADLVLAADVFVYLAALDAVFGEVARVLMPKRLFRLHGPGAWRRGRPSRCGFPLRPFGGLSARDCGAGRVFRRPVRGGLDAAGPRRRRARFPDGAGTARRLGEDEGVTSSPGRVRSGTCRDVFAPLPPCRNPSPAGSQAAAGGRARISSSCSRKARAGRSVLLVAPTGAGKTLAGFLPTLVDLAQPKPLPLAGRGRGGGRDEKARVGATFSAVSPRGTPPLSNSPPQGGREKAQLHTLYISPLKALAVDIARNLEMPVREMGLPIRIETRTGDTPSHKRARQVERPPDILLTTPEQLALLLAHRDARELFGGLQRVVLDELHSLVTSKRGDLLALGLARLYTLSPGLTAVGLSATVREPDDLRRYLVPQRDPTLPWRGRVGARQGGGAG